jgi:hypothetical protein
MRSTPFAVPVAPVAVAVDRLRAAVTAVADLAVAGAWGSLDGPDLLAATAALTGLADQVRAVAVDAARAVHTGQVARQVGFTATARWLEVAAGLSPGAARSALATGEKLVGEFPTTRGAFLAGAVSEGAVREITTSIPRALRHLPPGRYADQRDRLEALALATARTGTVAEVRRVISRALLVVDPAGADAAVLAAHDAQFLRFTPTAHGMDLHGFLSTESAALVLTALDQRIATHHRTGDLTPGERDELGLRPPGVREATRTRLNAAVLVEWAGHLLEDALAGTAHAARPHLTVTVHADDHTAGLGGTILLPGFGPVPVPNTTIERIGCDADIHPVLTAPPDHAHGSTTTDPGMAATARGPAPGSVHRSDTPHWTPDPTPWRTRATNPPGQQAEMHNTVAQLDAPDTDRDTDTDTVATTDAAGVPDFVEDIDAFDCWVRRLLGETGRHVLDVGRSFRSATPKIRRALAIRDQHCAFPDCDIDPSRCQAHHIITWEHHGETALNNLVLLCPRHHHLVHEGHWTITTSTDHDPGHPHHVTFHPPRTQLAA